MKKGPSQATAPIGKAEEALATVRRHRAGLLEDQMRKLLLAEEIQEYLLAIGETLEDQMRKLLLAGVPSERIMMQDVPSCRRTRIVDKLSPSGHVPAVLVEVVLVEWEPGT